MISMVLPTSAIMYASGSTDDNSEGTSDSGSTDDNAHSPPSDFLPPNVTHHHIMGLLMIMLIHHRLTSSPNVDSPSSDGSTDDRCRLISNAYGK